MISLFSWIAAAAPSWRALFEWIIVCKTWENKLVYSPEFIVKRIEMLTWRLNAAQVSLRMRDTTIRSTEKFISKSQNAPVIATTSFIQPSDVIISKPIPISHPPLEELPHIRDASNERKGGYSEIIFDFKEKIINLLVANCPSCQQLFTSQNYTLHNFDNKFIFILNNFDTNISLLRERNKVIEFIRWLIDLCDLENYH